MTTEFGARLRHERERRQISLQSISDNTKVTKSFFEGLERGDVSRWPHGIFRRSFVRAYAAAVGLDADAIVREFVELFPDPSEPPAAVPGDAAAAEPRPNERRPSKTQSTAKPPIGRRAIEHRPLSDRAAGLRLTLADTVRPFTGGRLLSAGRGRWEAVALDAGVVLGSALMIFILVDAFWLPLSAFMVCYYWGGILILGNTPGVCLKAPRPHGDSSPPAPFNFQALRSLCSDFVRRLGAAER